MNIVINIERGGKKGERGGIKLKDKTRKKEERQNQN